MAAEAHAEAVLAEAHAEVVLVEDHAVDSTVDIIADRSIIADLCLYSGQDFIVQIITDQGALAEF